MKTIKVAAAIITHDDQIFATQRGYGEFKDGWEFPGGKVEAGETPQEALIREIREELDTEIEVGELFDTVEYDYPTFHLSMDCFLCTVTSGSLVLKEHEAAKWLTRESLDSVAWLPADLGLIEKLKHRKLAVFFPGIGYHCDKPLLYYSEKLAREYQYETIKIAYHGLGKDLDEAFLDALSQTETCLEKVNWKQYEDVLFVSKSIGTAVACAYAKKHMVTCRNIYYTPLEKTFAFAPQSGIAFHGTADLWADTGMMQSKCRELHLPLFLVEEANHSLEVSHDTQRNLEILTRVMEGTRCFVEDAVWYRQLGELELDLELFANFVRHQKVDMCRRKIDGEWKTVADPFTDDWTQEEYQMLVGCLKNTVLTGGFVCGAFYRGALKGFVSVEAALFGGEHRYMDLSSIHVSEDMRGKGIGRNLFEKASAFAEQKGAGKLYISAHSAVETQAFYQSMGCVEAQWYHREHVEREPYDCQLEYRLRVE